MEGWGEVGEDGFWKEWSGTWVTKNFKGSHSIWGDAQKVDSWPEMNEGPAPAVAQPPVSRRSVMFSPSNVDCERPIDQESRVQGSDAPLSDEETQETGPGAPCGDAKEKGKVEINAVSSSSKSWLSERYAVREDLVEKILRRLNEGWPFIDAFTDGTNARCEEWFGPQGMYSDAFSVTWKFGEMGTLWCSPPFSKLLEVVQKVKRHKCRIILIAPDLPTYDFYEPMWEFCKKISLFPTIHGNV